jgi:hypothetical protein
MFTVTLLWSNYIMHLAISYLVESIDTVRKVVQIFITFWVVL